MHDKSANRDDLGKVKMYAAARHKLSHVPSNSQIIALLTKRERTKLLPLLRRKTMRSASGVTVIAVMTKPHPCPQPSPCHYCPGGPTLGVPQSYTGLEPAAMRGAQNEYDPYRQVRCRIEQLRAIGHCVDKVELIVMGGTFPSTSTDYQTWFIQKCLDAINGKTSASLEEAKNDAERSVVRNVGITVETRPDWAMETHVDQMLSMGVTRVELGVQNPSNEIYSLVGRKHTVQDVIDSTRIMKDTGLKLVYHMMPGMPGSDPTKDMEAFRLVFSDPGFRPDMVKLYPCLVMKGTETYEWYRRGLYKPYSTDEATDIIEQVKKIVPPWVRIMRVQRDIPAYLIEAGVKKSNLRQIVLTRMRERGVRCRCIRCREVGHRKQVDLVEPNPENVEILTTSYPASEGQETFISAEDPDRDILIGFLRLRVPSHKAHRTEMRAQRCAIVRELHVYGPLVPVGNHLAKAWQHKGYGAILLSKAEQITRNELRLGKILVISALGTKQYYMRFGYRHDGVYMSKLLEE